MDAPNSDSGLEVPSTPATGSSGMPENGFAYARHDLQPPSTRKSWQLLAGLETGVIGGGVMLVWFAFYAVLHGLYWWAIPNLLASNLYHDRTFRFGLGMATLAGVALHLAAAGVVGALFGLMVPVHSPGRAVLLGMLTAVTWYFVAYSVLWQRLNPGVAVGPWLPSFLMAHLLFGGCLCWYPRIYRSVERNFRDGTFPNVCDSTPST